VRANEAGSEASEDELALVDDEALDVDEFDVDGEEAEELAGLDADEAVAPDVKSVTSSSMTVSSSVSRPSTEDDEEAESPLVADAAPLVEDDEVVPSVDALAGGGPGGGPSVGWEPSPPERPPFEPAIDSIARKAVTSAETVAEEPASPEGVAEDDEDELSVVEPVAGEPLASVVAPDVAVAWAASCRRSWRSGFGWP